MIHHTRKIIVAMALATTTATVLAAAAGGPTTSPPAASPGGMMGDGRGPMGGGMGMMGMMQMMERCEKMMDGSGMPREALSMRLPPGNEKLELQMRAEMMQKLGEIAARYAERVQVGR